MIAGDFNQWAISDDLDEFNDIREVQVGPTRGQLSIDRIFTNLSRSVISSGTWAPLQAEKGEGEEEIKRSDHRVAYCTMSIARKESFTWKTYTYRHYNQQAEDRFKTWIVGHDWAKVYAVDGSNNKANTYQRTLQWAIEESFPLKTTRKKAVIYLGSAAQFLK